MNPSAQRSRGGCRGSRRRSDRVFNNKGKIKPAIEAFNQIVETGFFQTVEWDAVVALASSDLSSMDESLTSGFSEFFAV